VGFGKVLTACLVTYPFSGDCDTQKANTKALIAGTKLYNDYYDLLSQIIVKSPSTKLGLIMYPRFFDATTDPCDKQSFSYFPFNLGAKVTKALRAELNTMTDNLNTRLTSVISAVQDKYPTARLYVVDTDRSPNPGLNFDRHRFCWDEQNPQEFDDPITYFFGTAGSSEVPNGFVGGPLGSSIFLYDDWSTCNETAAANGEAGALVLCSMANQYHQYPYYPYNTSVWSDEPDGSDFVPASFIRMFHPRSTGVSSSLLCRSFLTRDSTLTFASFFSCLWTLLRLV
jgi:hypothetical protein